MGSCLEYHGLKDVWEPHCKYCGRDHVREIDIQGITKLKCRTQCDTCIGTEEKLCKIRDIIAKTIRIRDELTPNKQDQRAACEDILKRNREKRKYVIMELEAFFKQQKPQPEMARTPHND